MATLKSIKNKYLTASDGDLLGVTTNTENISALSFKLATADSLTKFNLVDGMADSYEDTSGVDAGSSTNETRDSGNFYYGGSSSDPTGGTVTTYSTYRVHTYEIGDTGEDFIAAGAGTIDYMIIAGGGGAGKGSDGNNAGGAGGAGGFRTATGFPVAAGTYVVTVGAKGLGSGQGGTSAGGNSTFSTITSTGGGTGAGTAGDGGDGGSGGGGGGFNGGEGGAGNTPSTSPSQGNPGGDGATSWNPVSRRAGGGGGGSGGSGGNVPSHTTGGSGGAGTSNLYQTGSPQTYAGGGGGGAQQGGSGGAAGSGGGGAGNGSSTPGGDATSRGSGGGGAGGGGGVGGNGSDGQVVIRYTAGSFITYQDLTLVSTAFTAQTQADNARVVLEEWPYRGTSTIDTDIKAYASRDNGSTWTQTPLASQGNVEAGYPGINYETKLLLTCDGITGGTTFTDTSTLGGNTAHTITANGDAQTSQTQKKFGSGSAYFDGTGDYLAVTAGLTDFQFGTDDFTIDFWMRMNAVDTQYRVMGDLNSGGSSTAWAFTKRGDNIIQFDSSTGSLLVAGPSAMVANTWYHIALVRNGNNFILYQDGVAGSTHVNSLTLPALVAAFSIGRHGDYNAQYYAGYLDEIRVTKGTAIWTSAFTPPTMAYVVNKRLLSGSVDISGQPAGTNMKYKVTTLNQAATKQSRIYATSMAWA